MARVARVARARGGNAGRWRDSRSTRHLGRHLLILYAITAAVVAAVFSTALLAGWLDTLTLLSGTHQRERTSAALSALQLTERDGTIALMGHLLAGDDRTLGDYRATVLARQSTFERLEAVASPRELAGPLALLRQQHGTLDPLAERAILARRDGSAMEAMRLWQRESAPVLVQIAAQIGALSEGQEQAQQARIDSVQQSHNVTLSLTFFFATTAALLGLWVTRRVILNITQPLEALAAAAAAIGVGKLETRVAPGLAAEFDMLGGVMNTMASQLATSRDDLQAAFAATERRNRELRLLSDVATALDSSLELAAIIECSLPIVLACFDAAVGAVVLYDETGERWYWQGHGENLAARGELESLVRHALGSSAFEGGQVLVLPADTAANGALMIPLAAAVRTHGVLALAVPSFRVVDQRDRALLAQVGGQIARAIENVRLYLAEKGRSAEAGMLAQMAQLTSGTLDLDRLARLIARYAVQVLGVDRCIVGFFDPRGEAGGRGSIQRLYQYGFPPQQAALVEGERESLQAIVRRHMLDGQTLVVPDAASDPRAEVRDLAQRLAARSFISVPLVARERSVGLIYLDTREPRQRGFDPQDQRILTAIADQAAAAIDGARLYEAERRRSAQLRVLNQTSQQIAASARLDDLFRGVTTTIRESFGYGEARIGLIEGDELRLLRYPEQGEGLVERREPLDGDGAAAWVVRHAAPRVAITEEGPGGGRARLIVPLRTKDRAIGVLEVLSDARSVAGAFDADDERILLSLGDQLGLAVEKNRLQERALSLAVVEERNRLARDLHDSVTQSLFSINLTVEATRLLLHRDTAAAEQQLLHLGERTREALAEMRNLIYSLRPAELEEQGLPVALKRWGERVRHDHLLPVDVLVEGGGLLRLSETQERELFRIAQEALNNVVKHAGATRATVRLRASPAAIMLLVEDDGAGFDAVAPPRADAFGTRGMRERVALLGGEIAFDSRPGHGTRVLVTIPRTTLMKPDRYVSVAPGATTLATMATGG